MVKTRKSQAVEVAEMENSDGEAARESSVIFTYEKNSRNKSKRGLQTKQKNSISKRKSTLTKAASFK